MKNVFNYIPEYIVKNIIEADWYGFREVAQVFLTSMIPVLELRGAIAFGPANNLPWLVTYIAAVLGNVLPVPFIIIFIRKILTLMRRIGPFERIAELIEKKAEKNRGKIEKYSTWGLFIFVAVPLPGTGAWTGALVAALTDMRLRRALPPIAAGVMAAGVIMTFFYYFLALMFPNISYCLVVLCVAAVVAIVLLAALFIKRMRAKSRNTP